MSSITCVLSTTLSVQPVSSNSLNIDFYLFISKYRSYLRNGKCNLRFIQISYQATIYVLIGITWAIYGYGYSYKNFDGVVSQRF